MKANVRGSQTMDPSHGGRHQPLLVFLIIILFLLAACSSERYRRSQIHAFRPFEESRVPTTAAPARVDVSTIQGAGHALSTSPPLPLPGGQQGRRDLKGLGAGLGDGQVGAGGEWVEGGGGKRGEGEEGMTSSAGTKKKSHEGGRSGTGKLPGRRCEAEGCR